jgi:predicted transcriptional regulator
MSYSVNNGALKIDLIYKLLEFTQNNQCNIILILLASNIKVKLFSRFFERPRIDRRGSPIFGLQKY